MLEAGREVGNYRIAGLLGRGGQGFVYRAVHVRLGTEHALKVLLVEQGPLRERLLDEGRIQARLRHPNLVPVTDVVEIDGALALVAELVAGVPMDAWVAAQRPSLDERLAVFRGVCAAVAAAHAARVVHRDLKPSNVIVERQGDTVVPRVTDFGVAKMLDAGVLATLPGLPVGTPGYMAPEQLRDASSVDARADLFALGCLLYELACGVRPFADPDLWTYAAALDAGTFVHPDDRVAGLPPGVGRAVVACLRVDPAARPADIARLLALLDDPSPAAAPRPRAPIPGTVPSAPTEPEAGRVSSPSAAFPAAAPTAVPIAPAVTVPASPAPSRRWYVAAALAAAIVGTAALAGWGFGVGGGATAIEAVATVPPAAAVAVTAPIAPDGPAIADAPPSADTPLVAAAPASPPIAAPVAARAASSPPSSEPGPRSPAAAPVGPAATVRAAPTPREPTLGRVVASGEGEVVWLAAGDVRHPPGAVPAGHYQVLVRFPGEPALVAAAAVAIQAGETTRLRCDASHLRCVPQEGR